MCIVRVPDDLNQQYDSGNGRLFHERWQWMHFNFAEEAAAIEVSAVRLEIHSTRRPGEGVQLGRIKLFYAASTPLDSSAAVSNRHILQLL